MATDNQSSNQHVMHRNSLYISYFGLREPLVQTQVLPYLRELASGGWNIHLITFEKGGPGSFSTDEQEKWRSQLSKEGITWYLNSYTDSRKLWAKLKDIFSGVRQARKIIRDKKIVIVHGRAHVGTTIGDFSRIFLGPALLFDIRGFNPEEQVESGRWAAHSLKYYLYKTVEKILIKRASGFILLTNAGRKVFFSKSSRSDIDSIEMYRLPDNRPVQIIPCCVDEKRFEIKSMDSKCNQVSKSDLGLNHCKRLVSHVGALGGLYPEDRIIAAFAAIYREMPDTGFVILSQTSADNLKKLYCNAGLPDKNLWVGRVTAQQVASYLAICDWGLSLKKESYSQLSCSPTKIPEYLLAGLPILCSRGIGDCDDIIRDNRVGIVFDAWNDQEIKTLAMGMLQIESDPDLKSVCRDTAKQLFDLKKIGGPRYRAIYEILLENQSRKS